MDGQTTFFAFSSQVDPSLAAVPTLCPAQQMLPPQRQGLAVQVLAGTHSVSQLAREHSVSRKFLAHQVDTAQHALELAFNPPDEPDHVLFYLPVTKTWLRQFVLALVLIGRSSYRGVAAILRDLFDFHISSGNVHNIVHGAVAKARTINHEYKLDNIRIGAHDEIFQANDPVLVGVDTASTFCYLLSLEEHRDAETWGIRLLELGDRGFAPNATIADGGTGLRAGQKLAMPGVPCWGDLFHLSKDANEVIRFLENRAYNTIEDCAKLQRQSARKQPQDQPLNSVAEQLCRAQATCDLAMALSDDISLLLNWLHYDILAVAGPCSADRRELYDFVLAELVARVPLCPHRLRPICRSLKNQRDNFLAFARQLDNQLELLGKEFQVSAELLRRLLINLSRDQRDPRRWSEEEALRAELHGRFWEIEERLAALAEGTVRASSLVENLNSRLRGYFFLRRQLGNEYLTLLQFFLNHRVLERSECPERHGRTPAEVLTGQDHPHWLEMLGYTRFQRN